MSNKSLIERLNAACVMSCTCMTKTSDIQYHNEMCTYRLHHEAMMRLITVEALLNRALDWIPADAPVRFEIVGALTGRTADEVRGVASTDEHQHNDECWEPDSGCDMGRNENYVKAVDASENGFCDHLWIPLSEIGASPKIDKCIVCKLEKHTTSGSIIAVMPEDFGDGIVE